MDLVRVIYTSRPFGFDGHTLSSILSTAERLNTRDNITGALICRADIFVQLLEGPEDKVRDTLARIAQDDRHVDLVVRVDEPAVKRMFPDWAMLHDPATSWLWTQDEVDAGAVERATVDEVKAFFTKLQSGPVATAV